MRILLVEDEPAHAKLAVREFKKLREVSRIDHVPDGQSALDFLNQKGEYQGTPLPNLILLDLKIPGMDGIELLKLLRAEKQWRNIPIVVLTTSELDADIRKAYEHGANSYLVKPMTTKAMGQMIEEIGLYWALRNRTPVD